MTTLHLSFLLFRCPINSSVSSSRPIHVKLNIFTSYFYVKTTSRQLLICLHIILHIIYLLGFTLPGGGSCENNSLYQFLLPLYHKVIMDTADSITTVFLRSTAIFHSNHYKHKNKHMTTITTMAINKISLPK